MSTLVRWSVPMAFLLGILHAKAVTGQQVHPNFIDTAASSCNFANNFVLLDQSLHLCKPCGQGPGFCISTKGQTVLFWKKKCMLWRNAGHCTDLFQETVSNKSATVSATLDYVQPLPQRPNLAIVQTTPHSIVTATQSSSFLQSIYPTVLAPAQGLPIWPIPLIILAILLAVFLTSIFVICRKHMKSRQRRSIDKPVELGSMGTPNDQQTHQVHAETAQEQEPLTGEGPDPVCNSIDEFSLNVSESLLAEIERTNSQPLNPPLAPSNTECLNDDSSVLRGAQSVEQFQVSIGPVSLNAQQPPDSQAVYLGPTTAVSDRHAPGYELGHSQSLPATPDRPLHQTAGKSAKSPVDDDSNCELRGTDATATSEDRTCASVDPPVRKRETQQQQNLQQQEEENLCPVAVCQAAAENAAEPTKVVVQALMAEQTTYPVTIPDTPNRPKTPLYES